jgi:ABC-2 type transport system ATP-binding protein
MKAIHANQHQAGPALETAELTKRFGERVAVDAVSLSVPRGTAYGFLGHNGAGKTTLIRMLLGLTHVSDGSASVLGLPVPAQRARALSRVGAIVEEPSFYPHLTGRENLKIAAAVRGPEARSRIDGTLHRVGLEQRADDRVRTYSLGMRQRLGIAAALLRGPRLLLLDEPATGLDPAGLRDMRSLIRRLAGEGITVMLSSHQLAEVEELCNRVAIIRKGKIAYEGELAELKRSVRVSRAQPGILDVRLTGEATGEPSEIRLRAEESAVAELSIALAESGVGLKLLANEQATLEDLFFRLTEGEAVADEALA